jgi:hypothetical protein
MERGRWAGPAASRETRRRWLRRVMVWVFLFSRLDYIGVVVDDRGDGKARQVLSAGEVGRDRVAVGAPDGRGELVEENKE